MRRSQHASRYSLDWFQLVHLVSYQLELTLLQVPLLQSQSLPVGVAALVSLRSADYKGFCRNLSGAQLMNFPRPVSTSSPRSSRRPSPLARQAPPTVASGKLRRSLSAKHDLITTLVLPPSTPTTALSLSPPLRSSLSLLFSLHFGM